MARLYKFSLRCVVEAATLIHWAESQPQACPHNPAHALDHALTAVLDSRYDDAIVAAIREEPAESDTGGHFQSPDYEIDVPAGVGPTVRDITWPFPVSVLAAKFAPPDAWEGDAVEVQVAPDTLFGVTAGAALAGAKIFSASAAALDIIKVGYWLKVADEDLGRAVAVDKAAGAIETEGVCSVDRPAGSTLKLTIKMMPWKALKSKYPWVVGDSKIGGSLIKKGTVVRVIYHNVNGLPKKFRFEIELLY